MIVEQADMADQFAIRLALDGQQSDPLEQPKADAADSRRNESSRPNK